MGWLFNASDRSLMGFTFGDVVVTEKNASTDRHFVAAICVWIKA